MSDAWDPAFVERGGMLWPLAEVARPLAAFPDWPSLDVLTDLAREAGAGVRFVPDVRRGGRRRGPVAVSALYDARIAVDGEVPTRARSWHDLLNALVWIAFPRTKRAIHARQHAALLREVKDGAAALPGARSRERDALTMLDEGGLAVLVEDGARVEAETAVARADTAAFARLRDAGRACGLVIGHAVHEHAVTGGAAPRAMVVVVATERVPTARAGRVALADALLASLVEDTRSLRSPRDYPAVHAARFGD